jgi:hypothetical protein
MAEYIAHPINENLRLKVEIDEYPSKPYHDGGFPIWRMEPSRTYSGYDAVQETDITSYVTPARLDDALSEVSREHDLTDKFVARYLRIFWGVTFMEMWHSGSYWYLTCDPADWREKVGVTDEATKREEYTKHAFTEWQAWYEGEAYMVTEQRRLWQRTTTRTWDPAMAENPGDPSSSDEIGEDTDEFYVWQETDNGSVGGFYGTPDDDMQRTMGWQFGWPEAVCKHCGEGINNDVTHGWVDADVEYDAQGERKYRTHCVTGVMMHTRGPLHEPKEK